MRTHGRLHFVSLESRLTPAIATWTGAGANNLWSNPLNWAGAVAPQPGDDLTFGLSAQGTVVNDFAPGTPFRSLRFSDLPYDVSGNAISLAAGIDGLRAGGLVFSLDVTLAASQTFTLGSGRDTGRINLNGQVLTVTTPDAGAGGGNLPPPPPPVFTFFGVISGTGGIIKDGAGRASLSADNTFAGPIDHRSGILIFPGDLSAGATGPTNQTQVEPGAVLFVSGTRTIPESITFANAAPDNRNPLLAGTFPDVVTFSGPITLTGDSRWLGAVVLAGGLFGTGSLSVQGSLVFPAGTTSPYTGTLLEETGPFTFDGNGPFGLTIANDARGVFGDGAIGPLTVQGQTHLAPTAANGVGALSTGNLVEGAMFDVAIGDLGAAHLIVHGTVALAGTLTLMPTSGFTPPANAVYRIIDNDGTDAVAGAFGGLPQGAQVTTINGVPLFVDYHGGDGNDVELRTTTPPPPPSGPMPAFAVAAGPGGGPQVNVYADSGALIRSFFAYDASFRGGVHVATADVTGDGVKEVITAPGFGGGPVIRIWDGTTGALLNEFNAYDPNFRGGAFVGAARLDSDSAADIVTGAGPTGGPHVKAFLTTHSGFPTSFLAYDIAFTGGVSVAATDGFTSGGTFIPGTIVTGAGPGGGPHVKSFSAFGGPLASFFAYEPSFTGGVYVASGAFNDASFGNDVKIITSPGAGRQPLVQVFDTNGVARSQFLAYDPAFIGGVTVAYRTLFGGDGAIITGAGPGGGPHVREWFFDPGPSPGLSFMAFDPTFLGGVFVA